MDLELESLDVELQENGPSGMSRPSSGTTGTMTARLKYVSSGLLLGRNEDPTGPLHHQRSGPTTSTTAPSKTLDNLGLTTIDKTSELEVPPEVRKEAVRRQPLLP
jgi:hypothetical protein